MSKKKQKSSPLTLAIVAFVIIISAILQKVGVLNGDEPNGRTVKEGKVENADLCVTFLNVGQGDCTLVRSDGCTMLVDTGDRDDSDGVVKYLKKNGIEKLDCLLITHQHADHMGEAGDIIKALDVEKIIIPDIPEKLTPTTAVYDNFLDAVEEKELYLDAAKDESFKLGKADVETFASDCETSNINNCSTLVKITCGERSFLITGDCEVEEEKQFLKDKKADLGADVLKAAHHGSDTSSSDAFLKQVSPAYSVISCAKVNRYGHPDKDTVKRLAKYSSKGVYITCEDGSVQFSTDGETLDVKTINETIRGE